MAHTFGTASTRTSSSANPITTAGFTLSALDTVLVLMMKVNGSSDRSGGAPTMANKAFTQANITQKAATSPEASCELWYLLNPTKLAAPGSHVITIPNAVGLTVFYTLATGQAKPGCTSAFDGANGGNGTSTNPTSGAVVTTVDGDIGFAIACSGATDFDPATPSATGFGTGTGTPLGTFDDGAHGSGQQYHLQSTKGSTALSWTFGTSDDWGIVQAYFSEVQAVSFNNYFGVDAGNGIMSVTEKIR